MPELLGELALTIGAGCPREDVLLRGHFGGASPRTLQGGTAGGASPRTLQVSQSAT
jgi:hypothetical protein